MEPYEGTYWKYSPKAITSNKHRSIVLAVVKTIYKEDEIKLKAWELELRSNSIYHPYFGLIPYEYYEDYNMFHKGSGIITPNFEFNPNDSNFYPIGTDLKRII